MALEIVILGIGILAHVNNRRGKCELKFEFGIKFPIDALQGNYCFSRYCRLSRYASLKTMMKSR